MGGGPQGHGRGRDIRRGGRFTRPQPTGPSRRDPPVAGRAGGSGGLERAGGRGECARAPPHGWIICGGGNGRGATGPWEGARHQARRAIYSPAAYGTEQARPACGGASGGLGGARARGWEGGVRAGPPARIDHLWRGKWEGGHRANGRGRDIRRGGRFTRPQRLGGSGGICGGGNGRGATGQMGGGATSGAEGDSLARSAWGGSGGTFAAGERDGGPQSPPKRWSGKRDLNPRLRPWQGRTLPLSYSRSAQRPLARVEEKNTSVRRDRQGQPRRIAWFRRASPPPQAGRGMRGTLEFRLTDHGPRTTDHGPRTTDHGPRTTVSTPPCA